jgi:glycosyltransferase involved in cell wall biosynthesis
MERSPAPEGLGKGHGTSAGRSADAKIPILFISSAEQPGADTFIHALIMRGLDRSRFDVHVACSAGSPSARTPAYTMLREIPDLKVRPANFGPSLSGGSLVDKAVGVLKLAGSVPSLAGLAGYVRRNRIAVLHSTDRPRDAVACALLGKMTAAKSIIHAHLKCADWMAGSQRWSMGQVDALVGVSNFVVRSLVENGYRQDRTHTVLNAIDLPRWDYRLDPGPVRRSLGVPAGAPIVACAARLFYGKGQDEVIRAVPAIREEFPDVRVLIIGSDDRFAMRTSFSAELKALAADLGVSANVIFTGQRSDMPAVMASCDVFALPSDEEPFGLVFLEAMAMKKPVVALDNGGTPEVVEHGKSGLLSAPGDRPALAANLKLLLRDPPLRSRMGEYGREQVEARFTAARMAADTAAVYDTLLQSRTAERAAVADGAAL